jgi:hypothetical protein
MAFPWLRIFSFFSTVMGITNFALERRGGRQSDAVRKTALEVGGPPLGRLEARLAGVVVAALKEAFDRDTRRLDLEREQFEAERRRAERALQLELLRQAGERELQRLRVLAAVAAACWISTFFFAVRLTGGSVGARIMFGFGWALLLGALAAAFAGQTAVTRFFAEADPDRGVELKPSVAGLLAPWLIVVGLGLIGVAVLVP